MVTVPAPAPTGTTDAKPPASKEAAAPPPTEGQSECEGGKSEPIPAAHEQQQEQPAAATTDPSSSPSQAPPPPLPLSPQDLKAYARDGFVLLPRAFPPTVAAACRERLWGVMEGSEGGGSGGGGRIERGDPSTWPVKFPLAFVFEEGHGEVRLVWVGWGVGVVGRVDRMNVIVGCSCMSRHVSPRG